MSQQLTVNEQEAKHWKLLFWTVSALLLIVMPLLSRSYGMSGDEWLQMEYGQHIWDYFFNGSTQALDYTNKNLQYTHQEYYGGLFDFPMNILHHWFPSISILTLRHFFNALLGALMMVFTGLLALRLSKKWSIGLLALIFIIFSPRIFGESMNNPKDIPFAAGFIMGMYFLIAFLQDFPNKVVKNAIGLALGWGIAFGVRSAGGLLLTGYFVIFIALYYFLHKDFRGQLTQNNNRLLKKLLLYLVIAIFAGYILALLCWPWGLQSPISHPIESLKEMTNRAIFIRVLFEGKYFMNTNLPWYYEFKWILISNPLIVLIGFAILLMLFPAARKQYGLFVVTLVVFGSFFPLLYMIYKKSTVYDTWRHVFFVYPFWVIAGALGWDVTARFIRNEKLKWLRLLIPVVGLLPAIIWTVRSHPFQSVYFNELEGGAKNAYGYYDLDYYQNSGKAAADWIKKNVKPISGKKIVVRSNMSAFYLYFTNDTSWIAADYGRYTERHHLDWDYYVAYPRYIPAELMQNNKWLLQNTVHSVEIDGVPLCVVIKRQSAAGIDAYNAFQKKDFVTAAGKYHDYILTDTTDDNALVNYGISLASTGQIAQAIPVINRAIQINPAEPQYWQLLAEFYKASGDTQNYQKAVSEAQNIAMQQQDEEQ